MDHQWKKYSLITSMPNQKGLYGINTLLSSLGVSYIRLYDSRLMLLRLVCQSNRKAY